MKRFALEMLIGLGFAFAWHFFLIAILFSQVGNIPDVKIYLDAFKDELTITYTLETKPSEADLLKANLVLERGINHVARDCFDLYALVIPYQITVKVEDK